MTQTYLNSRRKLRGASLLSGACLVLWLLMLLSPSSAMAITLTNGNYADGAIIANGTNSYTFTANKGDTIYLSAALLTGDGSFNPWIRIYGTDGVYLNLQDNSYTEARIAYVATNTGTFTVLVSSGNAGHSGTYRLRLAQVPGAFVTPAGDESGVLTNGGYRDGLIEVGDVDFYTFTANKGDNIYLSAALLTGDGSFNPWIRLYGTNGVYLNQEGSSYTEARIAYVATNSGTFTVLVSSGNAGHSGTYRLRLAQVPGVFFIPAGDQGGSLSNGTNYDGTIDRGDVDFYTFTANKGDNIYLSAALLTGDGSFNPWIRLYGTNGVYLNQEGSSYTEARIAYVATNSGTFTVLVSSGNAGHSGTYRLLLTGTSSQSFRPYGQITETGGAAVVGAVVTALVNSTPVAATITDASGNYQLASLSPGAYTLNVKHPTHGSATRSFTLAASTTRQDFQLAIKPPPPTATLTAVLPPTNLVARPRVPSGTQFLVYTNGRFVSGVSLNTNKMTIVLTHGWMSSSDEWPKDMALFLDIQGFSTTANIVAWDWRVNAIAPGGLSISAARAPSEGEALGSELLYLLGANYSRPIHFMGHSLGTLVNCRAADYIHGDAKNSPGYIAGPAFKLNPQKTHLTLFDEAGVVEGVNALTSITYGIFLPTSGDTGDLINNMLTKVIPDHSAWVDNYISEVGRLHPEAANVLLWRRLAVPLINDIVGAGLHGYSYEWYSDTILTPLASDMGFRNSFERNPFSSLPPVGTYFLQSLDVNGSFLAVTPMSASVANSLLNGQALVYPTLQTYQALNTAANWVANAEVSFGRGVQNLYLNGIQYAGNLVANVAESASSSLSGLSVYVGATGSSAASMIPAGAASLPSYWDLPFTLQKPAVTNLAPLVANGVSPNGAAAGADITTNTSVFVWLPVVVPTNTLGLSFQFQIAGAGPNEYMTMGVSNENYFSMESRYIDDSIWNFSGVIEISKYAGKQTQLFFSLNGDGALPEGKLSIRAIQFYTVAPPNLNVSLNGNQTSISWPAISTGWQLEETDNLSSTNHWIAVTNIPISANYENLVTNTLKNGPRFFRLKK